MATGLTAAALENQSPQYIETAKRLWENMAGKRMFITGGVGAIHEDEKFGPDYFLPPMHIWKPAQLSEPVFQPTHEPINLQCPLYGRSGKSALQQCTDWRFFVR